MIENFFKIAYRNLLPNKGFPTINTSVLAIEMPSAKLILLWVQNEVSFDNFYKNNDRLYQSWNKDKGNDGTYNRWNVTPKSLVAGLKEDYPEVEKATRVGYETYLFTVGEKKLNALGTISFQAIKAAIANPVKSLRTE